MPLDFTKPFQIVYENNTPIIYQDGKKYTLSGVEIKETEEIKTQEVKNEPVTTQTTSQTDSSTTKPRSRK